MAVGFVLDFAGMTGAQADAVLRELKLTNTPPAGQIFHCEMPLDNGGIRVVDVWESAEAIQRFFEGPLGKAFAAAGVAVPQERPDIREVRNILK